LVFGCSFGRGRCFGGAPATPFICGDRPLPALHTTGPPFQRGLGGWGHRWGGGWREGAELSLPGVDPPPGCDGPASVGWWRWVLRTATVWFRLLRGRVPGAPAFFFGPQNQLGAEKRVDRRELRDFLRKSTPCAGGWSAALRGF
jgi:hypothetical protein